MTLEERIAQAIIAAFDELGGDPHTAVEQAIRVGNAYEWMSQEQVKIAAAGGAEMIIPGLHAFTIPAGMSFLIRKLAHISWGMGAIKGQYVVETPYYSDLRNILTVWSNDMYFSPRMMSHKAISMEAFTYAMSAEGYAKLKAALKAADEAEQAAPDEADNVNLTRNTLEVLKTLVDDYAGDERAMRLVHTMLGAERAERVLQMAQQRPVGAEYFMTLDQTMGSRISTRLALRIGSQLASRVGGRFMVGFVPLVGAAFNALFNVQTLRSMAEAAEKYYDRPFTRAELEAL